LAKGFGHQSVVAAAETEIALMWHQLGRQRIAGGNCETIRAFAIRIVDSEELARYARDFRRGQGGFRQAAKITWRRFKKNDAGCNRNFH
jgi:hypothetical protein